MRIERSLRVLVTVVASLGMVATVATTASANRLAHGSFCSSTARLLSWACSAETKDDLLEGKAICLNIEDDQERAECGRELWVELVEAKDLCEEQYEARQELCEVFGEGRYDPDFDPENFEDDFSNLGTTNSHFPLPIGGEWHYEAEDEEQVVKVLDATKNVEDVTCIVVNDFVRGEESEEDTDDWFAQAKNGDVWYCGEESKDFEIFEGDVPQVPELVSNDGSFKHGVDGAKAGILFLGTPVVGATYRQEVALGDAEDVATVVSTTYGYGEDEELDELVPEALAEQYCPDDDCVVTKDFTPLEPGEFEYKYYSPGVGVFLETKPEDEEINVLVGCNVDPKCSPLP